MTGLREAPNSGLHPFLSLRAAAFSTEARMATNVAFLVAYRRLQLTKCGRQLPPLGRWRLVPVRSRGFAAPHRGSIGGTGVATRPPLPLVPGHNTLAGMSGCAGCRSIFFPGKVGPSPPYPAATPAIPSLATRR